VALGKHVTGKNTNFYSAAFYYPGPYANSPDCSPAAECALLKAEKAVFGVAIEGVKIVHAYSWTDGSLYMYIKTKLDKPQLKAVLDQALQERQLYVDELVLVEADYKTHKLNLKSDDHDHLTVAQLFE
jgi:hypothetical protein